MSSTAQKPAPKLKFPKSNSTVIVKLIDSTSEVKVPLAAVLKPSYTGHEFLHAPCLVFLIHHAPSNRTVVFDLGTRKDWQNLPPITPALIASLEGAHVKVEKDVAEILEENGVDVKGGEVEGIVWSHWHFDHTGNPALFPPSTKLIVGPGFKEGFLPGYPSKPENPLPESAFAGREVHELTFPDSERVIGGFKAHDYFGDGSFYILDVPGHTVGHLCALARVTAGEGGGDSFVFMGADACHHGGEFRPTEYLPLPSQVDLSPLRGQGVMRSCPGSLFEKLTSAKQRFYHAHDEFAFDHEKAEDSIEKLTVFDAAENVWVVIAHDQAVLEPDVGVDLFPKSINGWKKQGWAEKTRWRFLGDLEVAAKAATETN